MSSNAVAKREDQEPTRLPAIVAAPERDTLARLEENFRIAVRQRQLLEQYIKDRFTDRHSYEVQGGKRSLSKDGAELICGAHGLVPDYEQLAGPHEPPESPDAKYQITMKCILRDKGYADSFCGSGIGSASSWITKRDGTRRPRQNDPGLCHNATLKMAEKSAYIAATLNATAASEFFTQDIEDAPEHHAPPDSGDSPKPKSSAPVCPACGGPMWDNIAENDKREAEGKKRRPDYKCKKKECDGIIWSKNEIEPAEPDQQDGFQARLSFDELTHKLRQVEREQLLTPMDWLTQFGMMIGGAKLDPQERKDYACKIATEWALRGIALSDTETEVQNLPLVLQSKMKSGEPISSLLDLPAQEKIDAAFAARLGAIEAAKAGKAGSPF